MRQPTKHCARTGSKFRRRSFSKLFRKRFGRMARANDFVNFEVYHLFCTMIEISEVAKTPPEKRKIAAEEAYVEFLRGYPLFA